MITAAIVTHGCVDPFLDTQRWAGADLDHANVVVSYSMLDVIGRGAFADVYVCCLAQIALACRAFIQLELSRLAWVLK